jgi:myosin protein heavy chain
LNAELDSLRSLADSEHRQREAAEATLDERNEKIAELESKIHDAGIQANELRSKLFQVQMEKESSKKQ